MSTVYLCGAINGCTDDDAKGWRNAITPRLEANGWTVLDPMRRDYRGKEAANVVEIVQGDLADIDASDAMIVMAVRPSWGSAMELHYASERDIRIIAVFGGEHVSPWLVYHAEIASNPDRAVEMLGESVKRGPSLVPTSRVPVRLPGVGEVAAIQPPSRLRSLRPRDPRVVPGVGLSMITKQVFVLLAIGGEVCADRIYPHPYHYRITTASESVEISADDIVDLLVAKRIVAPHVSEWGDGYRYRVVDPVFIKDQALKGYTVGFGRCAVCGELPITATVNGAAVRHGHRKEAFGIPAVPPCAGSGQKLLGLVTRAAWIEAAA